MISLHVDDPSVASLAVAEMEMPRKAWDTYGSWRKVFLRVDATGGGIKLELTAFGKKPTMLGESTMLTFQPVPILRPRKGGSAWTLDKVGHDVDPEGVIKGGNQYVHGVWKGARVKTTEGVMTIDTVDAPNMNPITDKFPIGNPLPAS